jgi:hypothetical protein
VTGITVESTKIKNHKNIMTPPSSLSGSHLRTYEKIFQHPVSHNLEWREIRSLLGHIGQLTEESNGHLNIIRNGHTLTLHRSHSKDIAGIDELMAVRHFLQRSDTAAPPVNPTGHTLVVISHHEARIFHSDIHGSAPETVKFHDSRYLGHGDLKENSWAKEIPAAGSYFEPLATALKAATKILLFGHGSGSSSEMNMFETWLKKRYPELSNRIVGSIVVDEHHQSDGELLAKVRDFYARVRVLS